MLENLTVSCVRSHCALTGSQDFEPYVCFFSAGATYSESSPGALVARAQCGHAGSALAQTLRAPLVISIRRGNFLRFWKCVEMCFE